MPVNMLYVEGDLDAQLLNNVFAGAPVVRERGSKYALKGIVVTERRDSEKTGIAFLRDRDFDSEPDVSTPHTPKPVLTHGSGEFFGWIWYRHSIESYLLEPALMAKALSKSKLEIEAVIQKAGEELAVYQAARWVVGQARDKLPPSRELETHPPSGGNEFRLPSEMSEEACWQWLSTATREFVQPVYIAFAEDALRESFGRYQTKLSGLDVGAILVWFSGKHLIFFDPLPIGPVPNRYRDRLPGGSFCVNCSPILVIVWIKDGRNSFTRWDFSGDPPASRSNIP